MGQQQLLLIILGVIVVGIAIGVGITMFQDNAVSQNRDAMANDMMHLAAKARHYFGRPESMGGGSQSFIGITMDKLVTPGFMNNANGTYSIKEGSVTPITVTFVGIGKAISAKGDTTHLELIVRPSGPGTITLVSPQ